MISESLAHSPVVNTYDISMVVLVHLLALFACALAAHRKDNLNLGIYPGGIRVLDHRASVPLPAEALKDSHRCCRLSGGLTSITKYHPTSLCSSCTVLTLVKLPLPSRNLCGGRKACIFPSAMASTPKVNVLRTLQGSFHSP